MTKIFRYMTQLFSKKNSKREKKSLGNQSHMDETDKHYISCTEKRV
jgi:hypothetical protein